MALRFVSPPHTIRTLISSPGIVVSGCKLEDAQADQLANALMNNVKITELDVSFNNITVKGGQALLKAVCQSMSSVQEVFSVGNSAYPSDDILRLMSSSVSPLSGSLRLPALLHPRRF